jgi:hypothetical protein
VKVVTTQARGTGVTRIRNTTDDMKDPGERTAFLLDAMASGGQSAPIERMERDGQQQLVNSDRLPSDHGDYAPWLALGFTFGEPDERDPMFTPATLPPGWSREGSSHAMWSYLVDGLGRKRASIFYKAAFYDRSAHMSLTSLNSYVRDSVEYDGGPIIFDDQWATREAVAAAMAGIRDEQQERAGEFRSFAADESGRDARNRERCAEHAAEYEAAVAKYDAALAALPAA